MQSRPERVLVFGDDMRIFLTVVRSLGRAGKEVHAAPFNWHSPALRSRYVAAVHELPRYSDGNESWLRSVLALLEREAFSLVVPLCDDRSILPFHLHREEFSRFPVSLPDPKSMDVFFDKYQTRHLCNELGIPTAKGEMLSKYSETTQLISDFGLPLVIKPRRSYWADQLDTWGRVYIPETQQEVESVLQQVREPERFLVEQHFAGDGVGLSVISDAGRIRQAFQHRRLREGRAGSSSYRCSEALDPNLYDAATKLCAAVGFSGPCMFEFRQRPGTGDWILLETNARFWGSISLPVSLGLDFPLLAYHLNVGVALPPCREYQAGVRSRNLALDARNLLASLRHRKGS
jgi:predicted ATP-grasp superfamily ATP-dependent carboligase